MSLKKLPQLPATPSMSLTAGRRSSKVYKVSASTASSETPSPTFSTNGSRDSTELSTSFSDPDDYVAASAPHAALSATMESKPVKRRRRRVADNGNRRASGRVRKPTAKAQAEAEAQPQGPVPALNGVSPDPQPLADTIIVASSLPTEDRPSKDGSPIFPRPSQDVRKQDPSTSETSNNLATVPVDDAGASPNIKATENEAAATTIESPSTSPSRRVSRREKKPTAKVLSESPTTATKRAATDDPDDRPRKSARISHSGAKVPSKLRYSISSTNTEPAEALLKEDVPETPKKSKVIVLKSKRLSEVRVPGQNPPASAPRSSGFKGKSRSNAKTNKTAKANPVGFSAGQDPSTTCNLSCLSPSSRLLAFAEIARDMPDSDDDDDVIPGSVQDWRMYTQRWCDCDKVQPLPTQRTNSVELARALLPNTVSEGTKYEPVDLTGSATPEAELLSTPVNTILRATDAERLSQLFAGDAVKDHHTPAMKTSLPNGASFSAPQAHASRPNDDLSGYYSTSNLPKKTYEERLRDDHNALTDIRKRASARGLSWSFNMTYSDIHALLVESNERRRTSYSVQAQAPTSTSTYGVTGVANDIPAALGSPSGFGMLLPSGTFSGSQQTGGNRQRHKDGWVVYPTTNGTSDVSHNNAEVGSAVDGQSRRLSSPSRPKSSRFRVDPRGLRGESPGPGTIINIEERKNGSGKTSRRSRGLRSEGRE